MKTFQLNSPVEVAGKTYEELSLRNMKAKDMRLLAEEENSADNQINLVATLAQVSPDVIDELEIADYNQLCLFVLGQLKPKKSAKRS